MKKLLGCIVLAALTLTACQQKITVSSPGDNLKISFRLADNGTPEYSLSRKGTPMLDWSALGLVLADKDLSRGFTLLGTDTVSFDETWETVWGEERFIRNRYHQLTVHLQHVSGTQMDIVFRAFDDGFAFRYMFPSNTDSMVVMDEKTEYRFVREPQAWSIPWRTEYYEALWTREPISQKDTTCSPITLEFAEGGYGFLHEANLTDYPAENFYYAGNTIRTYLTPWQNGVAAYESGVWQTPWRMMVIADDLRGLLASRVMLNLNEPCRIEDTSWIHPMKFIGIWWGMHLKTMTWKQGPIHGATTANMKRYIDFAADNGFGGVLAEGWNEGWEAWDGTDPDAKFSFVKPYSDYDIDYLAKYAHSRGVEIVFHHETQGNAAQYENELDEAYNYMEHYGMHSVKTGYVSPIITTVDGKQYNRSQSGVRHYRRVIETAARHHVCIDNHEPVMPTGLCRTYPNFFTQEGIRGQEWNAWSADGGSPASHVATLPFTRMLAGPADYTPGVFCFDNPVQPNTRVHATLANQLGLFVTMYSPLQMACDLPENYMKHPAEFQFIRDVPCDWEQSRLLSGEIGKYLVMARQDRRSADWYIGAVNDDTPRDITLDWSFLFDENVETTSPNRDTAHTDKVYTAQIYRDAPDADWQTNPYATVIEPLQITATSAPLTLRLASGGGFAIRLKAE